MVHFTLRGGKSHQVKVIMAVKRAIHSLIVWRAAQKWASKNWDSGAACVRFGKGWQDKQSSS